ncbi:MAG TPA: hypothetical protein ENI73_07020 [Spirochaetes bacterium]|nr:hypothetical protein [Spirochaetota bacterium]
MEAALLVIIITAAMMIVGIVILSIVFIVVGKALQKKNDLFEMGLSLNKSGKTILKILLITVAVIFSILVIYSIVPGSANPRG